MTQYGDLGTRMKRYEAATRYLLSPRCYTVIRVDGKNFSSFTRGCDKPFDYDLMDALEATARQLVEQIHGAILAYHQSDEISVVLQDFATHSTEPWLGGVVQKQVSVAASMATAWFNAAWTNAASPAMFDARTFTIPTADEVENYLIWRQQDATRNSVNMAAAATFSPASLDGLNSNQRQERLFREAQINWNDYPTRAKRGSVTRREAFVEDVTYTRKDTGEVITKPNVERLRVITDQHPPIFTQDRGYLAGLLAVGS